MEAETVTRNAAVPVPCYCFIKHFYSSALKCSFYLAYMPRKYDANKASQGHQNIHGVITGKAFLVFLFLFQPMHT